MKHLREWATPLAMGSFLMIGTTGILMFFHASSMLGHVVHEWLSWLMVIGVVLHMVANWKACLAYFRKPVGLAILGLCVVITVLSAVPLGIGPPGKGRGHGPAGVASAEMPQTALGR